MVDSLPIVDHTASRTCGDLAPRRAPSRGRCSAAAPGADLTLNVSVNRGKKRLPIVKLRRIALPACCFTGTALTVHSKTLVNHLHAQLSDSAAFPHSPR